MVLELHRPLPRPVRGNPATLACFSGPLRRQESQYTCPQLVRLKDDFLCGGWKQRLQNTQLAMAGEPREAHATPATGYRRSSQRPGAD